MSICIRSDRSPRSTKERRRDVSVHPSDVEAAAVTALPALPRADVVLPLGAAPDTAWRAWTNHLSVRVRRAADQERSALARCLTSIARPPANASRRHVRTGRGGRCGSHRCARHGRRTGSAHTMSSAHCRRGLRSRPTGAGAIPNCRDTSADDRPSCRREMHGLDRAASQDRSMAQPAPRWLPRSRAPPRGSPERSRLESHRALPASHRFGWTARKAGVAIAIPLRHRLTAPIKSA